MNSMQVHVPESYSILDGLSYQLTLWVITWTAWWILNRYTWRYTHNRIYQQEAVCRVLQHTQTETFCSHLQVTHWDYLACVWLWCSVWVTVLCQGNEYLNFYLRLINLRTVFFVTEEFKAVIKYRVFVSSTIVQFNCTGGGELQVGALWVCSWTLIHTTMMCFGKIEF